MMPNKMHELKTLYMNTYGRKINLNELERKYKLPHWRDEFVGYLSYFSESEPASYYGVFPTRIYNDRELIWSSQSGDTMTNPDHSGNGLFVKGALKTYDLALQKGITSVYGFPSKASQRGFEKLGWIYSYNLRRIRIKILTFPLIFLSRKSGFISTLHASWFRLICSLLPKGTEFSGHIREAGFDGVDRDAEFWKYKLSNRNIKLLKFNEISFILKFQDGKLIIGDIDAYKKRIPYFFYIKLYVISMISFVSLLDYYSSPDDELMNKLKVYGEEAEALPFGWLSFKNNVNLSNMKFTAFDFDTY